MVFNTNKLDRNGRALPIAQGDDLKKLRETFTGNAYVIKPITDREEW